MRVPSQWTPTSPTNSERDRNLRRKGEMVRLRLRVGASESFFICSRRLNSLEACRPISTFMSPWGCRIGIGMGITTRDRFQEPEGRSSDAGFAISSAPGGLILARYIPHKGTLSHAIDLHKDLELNLTAGREDVGRRSRIGQAPTLAASKHLGDLVVPDPRDSPPLFKPDWHSEPGKEHTIARAVQSTRRRTSSRR